MSTIRHDLTTSASPRKVFEALTTVDGLRGWWAKNADIGKGEGATHELRFDKGGQTVVMRFAVQALEPDRGVRWLCTENANPVWKGTELEWTIVAKDDGAHVTFEHRGFAEASSPPYKMTVDGWGHFMASLSSYLDTGAGQPW